MSQEKSIAKTNAKNLVKIMVYVQSNVAKKTGNKFKTYRTQMVLEVVEDGQSKGAQPKFVDVCFPKELKKEFNDKFPRGIYYVPNTEFSTPKRYELVTRDGKLQFPLDKDGKVARPQVWIRKIDHIDEKPYIPDSSGFIVNEEPTEEVDMDEQPEIVGESLPFDEE